MAKKLFIKTYGCQMNVYDSTRMADVLEPFGYVESAELVGADLAILNTCHIREKAAEKMYSDLGRLNVEKMRMQAQGGGRMQIVVAGCVAQAEGEEIVARAPYVDVVVGPQNYHSLPELIAESERTRVAQLGLEFTEEAKFDLLPDSLRPQGASAFVSIQEGCDKFCSFCVVPYTRGKEFSRPVAAIEKEVRAHLAMGAVEITLLGQNVNAYHGVYSANDVITPSPLRGGVGRGAMNSAMPNLAPPRLTSPARGEEFNLAKLLHHLAKLPGLKRLRYTTSHPRDMGDDLIRAHGEIEQLMPMLHLPVQSGSDRILKAMNRRHDAAFYLSVIEKLRSVRPDMGFSSDFIVGFPGETDAEFEDTLRLVETVGFVSAYSFNYSPRPGTPAAEREGQVTQAVMDERLQRLQALIAAQQWRFNESKRGQVMPVLFDRPGKKPGQLIGRSPWMQSVVIEGSPQAMHQLVDVRIHEAYGLSLKGEVIGQYFQSRHPELVSG